MFEQYLERVVPVLVPVLCLDLFNEIGENGMVVLLSVMLRDLLPAGARKKLCLESGICDIQPVSQSVFFVAASLEEHFTDSATAAKSIKLRNISTAEETLVCIAGFQGRQCT